MDAASTGFAAAAIPLAVIPAGTALAGVFKSLRPQSRVEKWSERINQIIGVVSEKHNLVPASVMELFLVAIDRYLETKSDYEERILNGSCTWYGKGGEHGDRFAKVARRAWDSGKSVSTQATLSQQRCQLYHQNAPRNAQGKCATCFPPELEFPRRDGSEFSKQYNIAVWSAIMRSIISKSVVDLSSQSSLSPARPALRHQPLGSESRLLLNPRIGVDSAHFSLLESASSAIGSVDITEQFVAEEIVDQVGNDLIQLVDTAVQEYVPASAPP